jgi:uncharacterized membrane protein
MKWVSPLAILLPLLFVLLLFPVSTLAATLSGNIYTEELELATSALVEVDTQPQQRYLSKDGTYQFALPPGQYTLRVTYLERGNNETLTEDVTVTQEGEFTYDLFLLPGLEEESQFFEEVLTEFEEPEEYPVVEETHSITWPLVTLLGAIALLVILLILLYYKLRARFAAEDERIDEILALIKKEGRIHQKELRKRLPESEAKVSLMIAELEAKGKIEKIKKGRGNILVAKK